MRKTKAEAERTREAVLDAAERVFYEQGVAGGTLEEIARVAGLTRGAVYWHFANKLAIFTAIAERCINPHEEAFSQIGHGMRNDALGMLEDHILSTFRNYGADQGIYMRLTVVMLRCDYVGEMAPAADAHAALMRRLSRHIECFFREKLVPGCDARSWDAEVLGRAFFAIVHGALMLWLRDPGMFPLQTVGADGLRAFVEAIRTRWRPQRVAAP